MDMLLGLIFALCCILVTSEQPEHFHLEVSASTPGTSRRHEWRPQTQQQRQRRQQNQRRQQRQRRMVKRRPWQQWPRPLPLWETFRWHEQRQQRRKQRQQLRKLRREAHRQRMEEHMSWKQRRMWKPQHRFTNVSLKGEVDILECIVLNDVSIRKEVRVEGAGADCVFHADSASIIPYNEHPSLRVLASSSLLLEGQVDIFDCTVLTGEVAITGGSISWEPDNGTASGCVITGHDASIELLGDSSLRFRNVSLTGSIDFGSCGYFQDVDISGLTLQRTAHGTYLCTVIGSKASINAVGSKSLVDSAGDRSRVDFESVRLEGDVAFGVCVTAGFVQVDDSGDIRFRGCMSESCLFVDRNFILSNAAITFQDCKCGGMQAAGDVMLKSGASMSFKGCGNLKIEGGALLVEGSLHVEHGSSLEAENCVSWRGAGVHAAGGIESYGQLRFIDCWAKDAGGAFLSMGPAHVEGDVLIRRTSSYNRGACSLYRGGFFDGANIRFENLSGVAKPTFGPAAIDSQSGDRLTIKDVSFGQHVSAKGTIVETKGPLEVEGVHFTADAQHYHFVATKGQVLKDVDCDNVESCFFEAISPNAEAASGSISCRRGWGTPPSTASHHAGCARCPLGRVQLQHMEEAECQVCPKRSVKCLPDTLTVPEGFYGTESAKVFACPNPEACGGGTLPFQKTCKDGYFGEGCAQCAEHHALSDASVLVCVQCAESSVARAFQVLAWLGKSALVFGIASKSVLGSTGTAKASSIYLNQLLSFSTVASTVMSAMLQTPAAQELQETVARFLFQAASLIGSGQDVGGGGQSVQCILQYIGLQPSVWKGQVAFAAAVTMFTALLAAAKGPRVAVLVSINCFFPAFLGHFGRQLVCFRLGETEGLEGLHCPHVPSFPGGFALVLAVTVLTAAVILRVWWSLYGGVAVEEAKKEESEEAKIPLHVAFLTAPYHEAYAKWETERLLRKTTFTLLAAMLPVSASPSLQMSSLGLLLLGSLVMYMLCLPYKNERWNQAEVALLTVSLAMIFAIVALLARDLHWGQSDIVQVIVILFVTMIAAGTCGFLAFLTVRNLVLEHSAALPKSSSGTTRRRSGAPPPPKPRGSSAALSQIQSPALVPKPEIHVSHAHEPPATLPEFPPSIAAPATGQGPVQAPGKPADLPPGIGVSDVHTGPATLPESDPGMVVPDLQATPATLASRPGPGAQVPL